MGYILFPNPSIKTNFRFTTDMGIFDTKCSKCGSTEHAREDCPHDFFSTKCSKCGSNNHSSNECPHGFLSSKCSKCGSRDHSSENCPQGVFSTKCSNCGSREHSRNECPHDVFSTKCSRCGSRDHASNACPQRGYGRNSGSSTFSGGGGGELDSIKLIGIIIGICAALAVLVLALTIAPFVLLIIYVATMRKNPLWAVGGMVVSLILALDFGNEGWLWRNIYSDWKIGAQSNMFMVYLVMMGIITGFLAEKSLRDFWPYNKEGKWLERPIIRGLSMVLVLALIFLLPGFMKYNKLEKLNNMTYSDGSQRNEQPKTRSHPKPSPRVNPPRHERVAPRQQQTRQQPQQQTASITGDLVNVRSAPQVSSHNKVGILNRGDRVTILETRVPSNHSNLMLTIGSTEITLSDGSLHTLDKGKAVTLMQKMANGLAKVKTTLPNNRNVLGTVPFRQLKSSSGSTWFRVQKGSLIGWVHGDFVRN